MTGPDQTLPDGWFEELLSSGLTRGQVTELADKVCDTLYDLDGLAAAARDLFGDFDATRRDLEDLASDLWEIGDPVIRCDACGHWRRADNGCQFYSYTDDGVEKVFVRCGDCHQQYLTSPLEPISGHLDNEDVEVLSRLLAHAADRHDTVSESRVDDDGKAAKVWTVLAPNNELGRFYALRTDPQDPSRTALAAMPAPDRSTP